MESVQLATCKCAFVLALLVCHEILSIQGRQFRPILNKEANLSLIEANSETETTKKVGQTIPSNDNAGGQKYHQTTPTANNSAATKNNTKSSGNVSQNYGFGYGDPSALVHKDDFLPARSGQSPGAGHSFPNDNGLVKDNTPPMGERPFNITENSPDDFRSTSTGNSPV